MFKTTKASKKNPSNRAPDSYVLCFKEGKMVKILPKENPISDKWRKRICLNLQKAFYNEKLVTCCFDPDFYSKQNNWDRPSSMVCIEFHKVRGSTVDFGSYGLKCPADQNSRIEKLIPEYLGKFGLTYEIQSLKDGGKIFYIQGVDKNKFRGAEKGESSSSSSSALSKSNLFSGDSIPSNTENGGKPSSISTSNVPSSFTKG